MGVLEGLLGGIAGVTGCRGFNGEYYRILFHKGSRGSIKDNDVLNEVIGYLATDSNQH